MIPFLLRHWQIIAAIGAVLAAAWYLDHRGYQRAKQHEAIEKAEADRIIRETEKALLQQITDIDQLTANRLGEIDTQHRTIIQPIIQREVASDPRYTDPRCAIPDSLRDSLNSARRGTSGPPE